MKWPVVFGNYLSSNLTLISTNLFQIISGVLSAYKGCISRVQLYGPTNFAPTVNHMAGIAREFVDGSQYFILLIITDGIITDMPQTKKVGPQLKLQKTNICNFQLLLLG
jgi:hypothetical protein